MVKAAAQIKIDVFEQISDPQQAAEDIQKPEGIKEQQDGDQECVDRLVEQKPFNDVVFADVRPDINEFDRIDEHADKNSHQNDFKEKDIEVAHHPLRGAVVPLADLIHEIIK